MTEVLVNLLNICSDDELCGDDLDSLEDLTDAYRDQMNSDRLQVNLWTIFNISP